MLIYMYSVYLFQRGIHLPVPWPPPPPRRSGDPLRTRGAHRRPRADAHLAPGAGSELGGMIVIAGFCHLCSAK